MIGSAVRASSIATPYGTRLGQADHRTAAGEQADPGLGDAELDVLGDHEEVAGQRQLEPAGQREALDGGDHRLAGAVLEELAASRPAGRCGRTP